ncbi:MAG TPA: hypothetical protein DD417_10335 [Elusimicrobia bacterium]|nr:hypothetical protein [Elusimicrobiota bacterium]
MAAAVAAVTPAVSAAPISAQAAPIAARSAKARPDSAVRQATRAAHKLSKDNGRSGKASTLRQTFDGAGRWAVPGAETPVDLSEIDPGQTPGFKDKGDRGNHGSKKALKALEKDLEKLDRLQRALYAEGKRSVLVVVQGMDTSGKDGTIRYVLAPLNPQGVRVTSFKKPTEEEARHGFLWRIRKALPGQGMMGVFNRSQYEDILVPSVFGGLSQEVIQKRFDIINRFEKGLADRGVEVVKFFLHMSKAEQKRRLQDRLDDPEKRWKFSTSDLESRKKWDEFMATYGKILAWTSTPWAPWYVIPADNKWFRNQLIGRILRERMEAMGLSFPEPSEDLKDVVIPD